MPVPTILWSDGTDFSISQPAAPRSGGIPYQVPLLAVPSGLVPVGHLPCLLWSLSLTWTPGLTPSPLVADANLATAFFLDASNTQVGAAYEIRGAAGSGGVPARGLLPGGIRQGGYSATSGGVFDNGGNVVVTGFFDESNVIEGTIVAALWDMPPIPGGGVFSPFVFNAVIFDQVATSFSSHGDVASSVSLQHRGVQIFGFSQGQAAVPASPPTWLGPPANPTFAWETIITRASGIHWVGIGAATAPLDVSFNTFTFSTNSPTPLKSWYFESDAGYNIGDINQQNFVMVIG